MRWAVAESSTANESSAQPPEFVDDVDYTKLLDVTTICETTSSPPDAQSCYGFIIDKERKLKGPYNTAEWHKSLSSKILTLDVLLRRAAQPVQSIGPLDSGTLFKVDRIKLAVNLASTLLQLHGTPWVQERWSKRDILFFASHSDGITDPRQRPVDIDHPLLNQRFSSTGSETPSTMPNLPRPTHPNLSVLSLGIMLLELWFATPIEARRLPSDLADGQPNSSTDLAVAERWVKENSNRENMPAGYWRAVNSCVYCFFDPMPRNKTLEDPDFREAIWQNVAVPLEMELKAWLDGRI